MSTRSQWRVSRIALGIVAAPFLALVIAWAAMALRVDGPSSPTLAKVLAAGFVLVALGALALVRPFWRALAVVAVLWLTVLGWWLGITPRNDRDWQPDVARPAHVIADGSRVTIQNVRNFDYRSETDFTEHWEDRTYDLADVRGVDLFISYWGPTLIAHTIVSWEFADGRHLAVSIETRKEKGETYSSLLGFFRQYELYYVVADERDVVRLRTNYRGEQVFLYRLRARPELARAALESYLKEVDHLDHTPEWYNAFTHNCTTTIRGHAQEVGVYNRLDWRLLVNGKGDEMLYERGTIATSLPFPELRAHSDITAKAKAADQDPAFSERIRVDLPPRPLPQ